MNPAKTTSASSPMRWTTCLMAGLFSAVTALQADAAIVTIDLTNAGTNNVNITGLNAGMTFGQTKLTLPGFVGGQQLEIVFDSDLIGFDPDGDMQIAVTGGDTTPVNFSSGASIDSNATYTGTDTRTMFYQDVYGGTPPASNASNFGAGSYLGFRFGTAGVFNYGYIEVLWTWTGNPATSSFQLLSAAYESTANTAIFAPGASAVPGGSGLMALMALGGGVFRRRGRAA